MAPRNAGVVERARLRVAAGEHEKNPRAVGQLAQRGVADHAVRLHAVVGDRVTILIGIRSSTSIAMRTSGVLT